MAALSVLTRSTFYISPQADSGTRLCYSSAHTRESASALVVTVTIDCED